MKYCEKCNAINLNEQIFCRKCNHQFEDFDWNRVEHENIYSNTLNNVFREADRDIHNNYFKVSLKKDGIKFIIWTVICLYGVYYGLNNSLWYYYVSAIGYLMLIAIKYYKLFFAIFNIGLEEKIGNKIFYNYRIESFKLILGGILVLIVFLPFIKFVGEAYLAIYSVIIPGSLVCIILGLDFFIRSSVFNTYNDYYYVITEYLMFLMPSSGIFGLLNYGLYEGLHNISLNILCITLYLLIFFSILFLDKVNKHTKYDIRGPGSWFLFYAVGVPFIPAIICFTILCLSGIIH